MNPTPNVIRMYIQVQILHTFIENIRGILVRFVEFEPNVLIGHLSSNIICNMHGQGLESP